MQDARKNAPSGNVKVRKRLTIRQEWLYKGYEIQFPDHKDGTLYQIPHDELVKIVGETANYLNTKSWVEDGGYSIGEPSRKLLDKLSIYTVKG